jgi:hypothetical protein
VSDKLLEEERKKKNNNKKRSKHNVSQTSFGGHNNHTFVAMVFRLKMAKMLKKMKNTKMIIAGYSPNRN